MTRGRVVLRQLVIVLITFLSFVLLSEACRTKRISSFAGVTFHFGVSSLALIVGNFGYWRRLRSYLIEHDKEEWKRLGAWVQIENQGTFAWMRFLWFKKVGADTRLRGFQVEGRICSVTILFIGLQLAITQSWF